jgi:asparagine synthase (glutamine-hydrolysing)
LAWFATDPAAARSVSGRLRRASASAGAIVPPTFMRTDMGGATWGLAVWHLKDMGGYRWPTVAAGGGVTAISLGIPVAGNVTGGPLGMARRLLDGADVHADVVPPFGLIARDDAAGRLVIQQDWLGQCRIFTAAASGVMAFSNRSTLLGKLLSGRATPSRSGWASYAVTGHFGGDSSPVDGVRLLHPGERVTCRPTPIGWHIGHDTRFCADDVVRNGLAARGDGTAAVLDNAAMAVRATVSSLGALYADEIVLGLSGGKDSRVLAAALLDAGQRPRFVTNDDLAAEAEVARRLVEIVGDTRGLRPAHDVSPAAAPDDVLDVGLAERVLRLQRQHDFQFPATYFARPAVAERLADATHRLVITGAAGELATGYWYPADDDETPDATLAGARHHLLSGAREHVVEPDDWAREDARLVALVDHAASLGLVGFERLDYVYLMERMRRWATSAYSIGTVVPFLTPAVVTATFALTSQQKRSRCLHDELLRRFMPEWIAVPYVSAATGPSRATQIWDGDGLAATRRLVENLPTRGIGTIVGARFVRQALRDAAAGRPMVRHRKTLEQFVALAIASGTLEPVGAVRLAIRQARRKRFIPGQRVAGRIARVAALGALRSR